MVKDLDEATLEAGSRFGEKLYAFLKVIEMVAK